jgi:hypothetical protein
MLVMPIVTLTAVITAYKIEMFLVLLKISNVMKAAAIPMNRSNVPGMQKNSKGLLWETSDITCPSTLNP